MVNVAVVQDLYVNVWFDWNRDGDWDDTLMCDAGVPAPEWAVQDQFIPAGSLVVGLNQIKSNPFVTWHPPQEANEIWMRITLSDTQWNGTTGQGHGGSASLAGYTYGETEDYVFEPNFACDCPGDVADTTSSPIPDGQVDIGDLNYILIQMLTQYPAGDPTGQYLLSSPSQQLLNCGDVANTVSNPLPDGQIDIGDLNYILIQMLTQYPAGDPTGLYLLPSCL
jgi:hypothetical protein